MLILLYIIIISGSVLGTLYNKMLLFVEFHVVGS